MKTLGVAKNGDRIVSMTRGEHIAFKEAEQAYKRDEYIWLSGFFDEGTQVDCNLEPIFKAFIVFLSVKMQANQLKKLTKQIEKITGTLPEETKK